MIAQYRPDIARALEQTVVNLKTLEQSLEILRADLATLAHSIGHPQAAQLVLTPGRNLGIVGAGALNTINPLQAGAYGPQAVSPLGQFGQVGAYGGGFQIPFVGVPWQTPGFGFPNVATPFVGQPNVANPYAQLYR